MANRIYFYDMTDWARLWYDESFNAGPDEDLCLQGDVDIQCSFAECIDTIHGVLRVDISGVGRPVPDKPVFVKDTCSP